MRFVKTLTVTAGKTIGDPSIDFIRLIAGTLIRIEIAFPPGPANLVSVVVRDVNLQIAPANPEGSFAWDDHTHSFSMRYPMEDAPYELTLMGWSPDAIYDHDIVFRFDIDPAEEDDREAILDYLSRILGLPGR